MLLLLWLVLLLRMLLLLLLRLLLLLLVLEPRWFGLRVLVLVGEDVLGLCLEHGEGRIIGLK